VPQIIQAQSFVTFNYTMIPLTDSARETPALLFCAFDAERGTYVDLTVPSVPVSVKRGSGNASDLRAVLQAQDLTAEHEPEPVLSGLTPSPGLAGSLLPVQQRTWFPLLHLVPAAALLALYLWDRHRRFCEQHPEIVLRRRALRALRRQRRALAKAAHARDAATFTSCAVNAMQVAVAPYFPAEPRALVGADVLTVLPQEEQAGPRGRIVRRLFSKADALRFAADPEETKDLFKLRTEIEGVLDHLEAKLCT
jgi:hypothetical protein